jgi:CSLREA domain-containing protein
MSLKTNYVNALISGDGRFVAYNEKVYGTLNGLNAVFQDRIWVADVEEMASNPQKVPEMVFDLAVTRLPTNYLGGPWVSGGITLMDIDMNGKTILFGLGNSFFILDISTKQITEILPTLYDPRAGPIGLYSPRAFSLSGDGRWVFAVSSGPWDYTLELVIQPWPSTNYYTWVPHFNTDQKLWIWRVPASVSQIQQGQGVSPWSLLLSQGLIYDTWDINSTYTGSMITYGVSTLVAVGPDTRWENRWYVSQGQGSSLISPPMGNTELSDLTISADGNWLAYASWAADTNMVPQGITPVIYTARSDGTNPRPLKNQFGRYYHRQGRPRLSQHGERVLYSASVYSELQLWIANADNSGMRPLADPKYNAWGGSLAYSGRDVAFVFAKNAESPHQVMIIRGLENLDLVVNTTDDGDEGIGDPGHFSLREAINYANGVMGFDRITFNIPTADPGYDPTTRTFNIRLNSPLPEFDDPVEIDGTTQPGGKVVLDGSNAGPGANGLYKTWEWRGNGDLSTNGGQSTIKGLVINRFSGHGIVLAGNGTSVVSGNFIGCDVSGKIALGNGGGGICIANASGNMLMANRIVFNAGNGVTVGSGSNNVIQANAISGNGGLGIDLGGDGYTPNDALDADSGPNQLQNYPIITFVTNVNGQTQVTGTLHSRPGTTFRVELFNESGAEFLKTIDITTDGGGNRDFQVTFDRPLTNVTATATDPAGNTSEFSLESLIVNTTGDEPDADPNDGLADVDLNKGSLQTTLRAAIQEANRRSGTNIIIFAIPTSDPGYNRETGAFTILPRSPLPVIANVVVLEGKTQSGGQIELAGRYAGAGANGLHLQAGDSTVRGLVINTFDGSGILLEGKGGNLIEGNFIGTDVSGMTDFVNTHLGNRCGIYISNCGWNWIHTNLVSGNLEDGIVLTGQQAKENLLSENLVGVNAEGSNAALTGVGNKRHGIRVEDAPENQVQSNLISGNQGAGIYVKGQQATGNVIQGNLLGTEKTGAYTDYFGGPGGKYPATDLRNRLDDILIEDAPRNLVGGIAPAPGTPPGNLISGSGDCGIHIKGAGAVGNVVQGNLIGTDITGKLKLSNFADGVFIDGSPANIIGGTEKGAGNVISGMGSRFLDPLVATSVGHGVSIRGPTATGNIVQGNLIGSDITGTEPLRLFVREPLVTFREGNTGAGVAIQDAPGNFIGGTSPTAGNLISGNGRGITIEGNLSSSNVIQGNVIGATLNEYEPLLNEYNGVYILDAHHTLIGGSEPGAGNLIAFNGLPTSENAEPVGNGIFIRSGNQNQMLYNTICSNGVHGVVISSDTNSNSGFGNAILYNRIFGNGGLGIDLDNDDRATRNPGGQKQYGPNRLQNFPDIISVNPDPAIPDRQILEGFFSSRPNTLFELQFYSNTEKDSSGFGEGESYISSLQVRTDGAGQVSFTNSLPSSARNIAALAVDPDGNTSEFSGFVPLLVNRAGDEPDADPQDGVADIDLKTLGLQTTLRAAMQEANRTPGRNFIVFDIPGEAVPVIRPQSALPTVQGPIVIDATTQGNLSGQPQGVPGRVVVDGSQAGLAVDGLALSLGDNTVAGLVIQNFKGNGISAGTNTTALNVQDIEIRNNEGWGIKSGGRMVSFNQRVADVRFPGKLEQPSLITANGKDGLGGGIYSEFDVRARSLEVSHNQGLGVFAMRDITLSQLKVNYNLGSGIFCNQGSVDIMRGSTNYTEVNQVIGNGGHGIWSGEPLAVNETSAIPEGVRIRTPILVQSNAAWGIHARGVVFVNVIVAYMGSYRTTSLVSDNGGAKEWYDTFDTSAGFRTVREPWLPGDSGGIWSEADVTGNWLEVTDNNGPGIVANRNVYLRVIKANYNLGPGIQSLVGNITVDRDRGIDNTEDDQVIGNKGPGIFAGSRYAISFLGSGETLGEDNINISTHIQVRDNGGWGLFTDSGSIYVNVDPTVNRPISDKTSFLTGNGNPSLGCFHMTQEGQLWEDPPRGHDPGGMAANRGWVMARRIDVSNNQRGPGIFATSDIDLRVLQVNHNAGPGIQSFQGTITIESMSGVSSEINQISDNLGPGILAGWEARFSKDPSQERGTNNVVILANLQMHRNVGWGIFAMNGSVLANVNSSTGGPLGSRSISITDNGNISPLCYLVGRSGDCRPIPGAWRGGGIVANRGDVQVANAEIIDNQGIGLGATWDIDVLTGQVGKNTGGDFDAGGKITVGPDVLRYDKELDNVGDNVEDQAPNNGDGNRDGVPDSQQANVTSLRGVGNELVTIAAPTGTALMQVANQASSGQVEAPPTVEFPVGCFSFQVKLPTAAAIQSLSVSTWYPGLGVRAWATEKGAIEVELILPDGINPTAYYRWGPTPDNLTHHWYRFDFDGETGALIQTNKVLLHYVDGKRGDDDLAANGIIVEGMGGPARQYQLRLRDIRRLTDDQVQFQLEGIAGKQHQIEASSNLLDWVKILNTNAPSNLIDIVDTNAPSFRHRFYRALLFPLSE